MAIKRYCDVIISVYYGVCNKTVKGLGGGGSGLYRYAKAINLKFIDKPQRIQVNKTQNMKTSIIKLR